MRQKRNYFFQDDRGYLTIELTMIFTVIFFSLLLILFMGMVLYQEVSVQSLAVRASERGSVVYASRVADMNTGVKTPEDFKIRDPYRNIPFLDGGGKRAYQALVEGYVTGQLGKNAILSGMPRQKTEVVDCLIIKRIKVNIQCDYHMPVASIPRMFGMEGPFHINTTAVSTVVDAPDFVRNVDLASDVLKQTRLFATVESGYGKIMDAIKKIQDFFK